jgi:hypothetical protein
MLNNDAHRRYALSALYRGACINRALLFVKFSSDGCRASWRPVCWRHSPIRRRLKRIPYRRAGEAISLAMRNGDCVSARIKPAAPVRHCRNSIGMHRRLSVAVEIFDPP